MKGTLIKRNASTEQVVRYCQYVASKTSNSKSIDYLLSQYPFEARLSWFEKMFWLIDSMTEYRYDDPGREQIKTPDVLLLEEKNGDCDDYSTTWLSLLKRVEVKAMPKIVDYESDGFWDHIYVIVPVRGREYITLDNVMGKFKKKFNVEVDYQKDKIFRPFK
jgi:transglutaminase-like putative cysteine protease